MTRVKGESRAAPRGANQPRDGVDGREARRLATRQALAEAAIRLFDEHGFDETTVDEIVAEVGVTSRTFFLHFATKAAAAFPDHEERMDSFRESLAARPEGMDVLLHLKQVMVAGITKSQTSRTRQQRYRLLTTVSALRDEDARTDRDYELAIVDYLEPHWGSTPEARLRANAVANVTMGVARAALISWAVDGLNPGHSVDRLLGRLFGSPFDEPLHSLKRR
ncbi:MAG: TetR family transcriptional regulator [Acidimicrobiia bacterium]